MYIQSILNPTNKYIQVNKEITKMAAPRPCDRCRKHRIKCDRSLYGCNHCTRNSIMCEYKYVPKKRGPKSKLERDCNYLNSLNNIKDSDDACIPSPDPSCFNESNFTYSLGVPHHGINKVQYGFDACNFNLPIPPPIPPILISKYFSNLQSPQSMADGFSSSYQDLSMTLTPNPQDLCTTFNPSPQELAQCFSYSTKDLSLALSPELNQYAFGTPLGQENYINPLDTYLTPGNLGTDYWLPIPPSYFTQSTEYSAGSELSPMIL